MDWTGNELSCLVPPTFVEATNGARVWTRGTHRKRERGRGPTTHWVSTKHRTRPVELGGRRTLPLPPIQWYHLYTVVCLRVFTLSKNRIETTVYYYYYYFSGERVVSTLYFSF